MSNSAERSRFLRLTVPYNFIFCTRSANLQKNKYAMIIEWKKYLNSINDFAWKHNCSTEKSWRKMGDQQNWPYVMAQTQPQNRSSSTNVSLFFFPRVWRETRPQLMCLDISPHLLCHSWRGFQKAPNFQSVDTRDDTEYHITCFNKGAESKSSKRIKVHEFYHRKLQLLYRE